MRYTTIIDITEYPVIWSSYSCRALYLYLVLKSGWHDDDRDMIRASIRQLALATGLTKSAVEHAIRQLTKAGLLAKKEGAWMVTKWVLQGPVTARAKTRQQQADMDAAALLQQERDRQAKQLDLDRRKKEELARQGKNGWMVYYEQCVEKAAHGDLQAAQIVERDKDRYNKLAAQFKAQQNSKRS